MAGVIALALLALSMQRKYQIAGKHDWIEPLNLYVMVVAEPSERKSAVINQMIKVIHAFEANYNEAHALEREKNEIEYQSLVAKRNKLSKSYEQEQKSLETRIKELQDFVNKENEKYLNASYLINLVKKYTEINELMNEIVQEFIQKVVVHHKVKIDDVKTQQVDIYYNGIGHIEI